MSRRGDRADDGNTTDREHQVRDATADVFGFVEDGLYVAVAVALTIAGIVLLGYSLYTFLANFGDGALTDNILELLDNLLLVFIVTEIIHTVRAVIDEKVLLAEPFLIVGIVAAIRRLIVVGAEAKELVGKPEFTDVLFEIGVLAGAVILLTASIFLLRNTHRSEPRPEHEPD
jgi:uncharacterized membrane protein (DUF373 family)